MKLKLLIISIIAITLFSCENELDRVGLGIQPEVDNINVFSDTIYIDSETIRMDSIYAKTINGMLGQYYDPVYGSLKADYVCQFYTPKAGLFIDTVYEDKIDSVTLNIFYYINSSTGDSLAPMEVSVYPVVKTLERNYYTNADPAQFCDMNTLWARKAYTARNLSIPDSAYNNMVALRYPMKLQVKLPTSIGVRLYEEFMNPQSNAFNSIESFTEFFKGVYVKSTYGVGNLIQVMATDLFVHYEKLQRAKDINGNDSNYIAKTMTVLNVTKEVIQLNQYQDVYDNYLLEPNDERTYIKTPTGIFTKLTIPIPKIIEEIGKKKFSNVKLVLTAFEKSGWEYALKFPQKLLLINEDSVITFFENQLLPNNSVYYSADFRGYIYDFGNISIVVQNAMLNAPDRDLELLVIPITYLSYINSQGAQIPYASAHYLNLSGISLKKGPKFLKLQILATDLDLKNMSNP